MNTTAQSLLATLAISVLPVFILPFVPVADSASSAAAAGGGGGASREQRVLRVLLAFAVGGLLGDVFLHLLPHSAGFAHCHDHGEEHGHELGAAAAAGGGSAASAAHAHNHEHDQVHEHGHGHEHDAHHRHDPASLGGAEAAAPAGDDAHPLVPPGFWVVLGVLAFFTVEKIVRYRSLGAGGRGHGHSHGHSHGSKGAGQAGAESSAAGSASAAGAGAADDARVHGLRVSGILNLVADAAHNFTDGMAIAASFQSGVGVGMSTTIAVLLHEIPHEVGDFAILIQSGMSRRRAILAQLLTAVGAILGCLLANVLAESVLSASAVILPFTAGGFVYIATVTVLPELLENCEPVQTVYEVLSVSLGASLMLLVGVLEAH